MASQICPVRQKKMALLKDKFMMATALFMVKTGMLYIEHTSQLEYLLLFFGHAILTINSTISL